MTGVQTKVRDDVALDIVEGGPVAKFSHARLPYHPAIQERFGIDKGAWKVLVEAIWPAAKTVDSVAMALAYCKARNLDPLKRVVHIVPMWDSTRKAMVETVWPGIAELRTTAFRTGQYAGCDEAEFGPTIESKFDGGDLKHPEWCRITVHRELAGRVCKFVGPKVLWLESYATKKHDTDAPNSMWRERAEGQIEKCAEAAALRRAFPEELGNVYSAEEMAGRHLVDDAASVPVAPPAPPPAASALEGEVARHEPAADASAAGDDRPVTLLPPEESGELKEGLLKRLDKCGTTKAVTAWRQSADISILTMQPEDREEVEELRDSLLADLFEREQAEA
jgi:phage recombination protein Bet